MNKIILTAAVSCLFTLSASAQTTQVTPGATAPATTTQSIGPAPASGPQHQILTTALSPQTRQTLQQAMNSAPAPAAK